MEATVEAEKTSAAAGGTHAGETQAKVSSETDDSFATVDCPNSVIEHPHIEKRMQIGRGRRVLICYLRKMSPVRILKKFRDCYVANLGSCAQHYVSSYSSYDLGLMGHHDSPIPPSLRTSMNNHQDLYGSEFCLSPAFKKSFNESLQNGSGAFVESDPGAGPFRKSFSDFDSCASPVLKRTSSDATALYSRTPGNSRLGYCQRSPTRAFGAEAMIMFPIQETPEVILVSFRKEAQDLRLASFRKEVAEPELSLGKDGEWPPHREDTIRAVSNFQVKEGFEAEHELTPSPIAV